MALAEQVDGLPRSTLGDAGVILDARAKDAYRRRPAEIDEKIEQARVMGDAERAASHASSTFSLHADAALAKAERIPAPIG